MAIFAYSSVSKPSSRTVSASTEAMMFLPLSFSLISISHTSQLIHGTLHQHPDQMGTVSGTATEIALSGSVFGHESGKAFVKCLETRFNDYFKADKPYSDFIRWAKYYTRRLDDEDLLSS